MGVTLDDLTVPVRRPDKDWNNDGYVLLKGIIPDHLIDAYARRWINDNRVENDRPGGYPYCTPYMDVPELAVLGSLPDVHECMADLVGEPVGMHLNLSGWVTTERDWHQDTYLNPPHVGDYYVAAWYALDDIDPQSGPFQLVPGSHQWFEVTQEKTLAALEPHERHDPAWPKYSERFLTPLFTEEIERRGDDILTHLPERGDVLLWHGRLIHRGSLAAVPGMERRSLIIHYSGINHRQDMPQAEPYRGGYIFPLHGNQPVR
jgi:hypothetical protein